MVEPAKGRLTMWGQIASAAINVAGGLAGSLLGRKRRTRTDFAGLVADAKKAGINPLTALRATGGAGNLITQEPRLSSFEFMSEALGDAVQTAFNQEQSRRDEEVEAIKLETMREELKRLKTDNLLPITGLPFGSSIPLYAGPGVGATGTAKARVRPALSPEPMPRHRSPVQVMADDGLPRANPDDPVEAETDLWASARSGGVVGLVDEVIARNIGPDPMTLAKRHGQRVRDWFGGFFAPPLRTYPRDHPARQGRRQ